LVLAAGHGTRAEASGLVGPKPFLELDGQSIVGRLLMQLERSAVMRTLVVAVRPEHRVAVDALVDATVSLPTTVVECATESSIETLHAGLSEVNTPVTVVLAADLVVRTDEMTDFLVDAVAAMATDRSIMAVQPIGACLQASRGHFKIGPDGYLTCAATDAGYASEGPRVFASEPLVDAIGTSTVQRFTGILSLVEGLLHAGGHMRGLPLRTVMDIDDRDDLELARRLVENGTLK
jgi:GTP:adenosylcobinamide-phosphate guanylyltransferase